MEQTRHPDAGRQVWQPMRLTHVSTIGDLMRSNVGSRRDNAGGSSCPTMGRQVGGTGTPCA